MSRAARGLTRLGGLAALLLVAACSTTVTTTSGPVTESRPNPGAKAEEGDAARRAQVRLELAQAYFSNGQLNTALEQVKLALDADPKLVPAYNLRGLIQASLGDERDAEDSFRRALALNPRDIDALQNYGWFLCQHKRYPEADAQFVQALAVPANRAPSRTLLAQGVCQMRAGSLDAAERSLMRASEIEPGNPTLAYNLAELQYKRGEYERARFYIRRVNAVKSQVSAPTLWLAARIEHKLGNTTGVEVLGSELRRNYRESREAVAFERGQFNE